MNFSGRVSHLCGLMVLATPFAVRYLKSVSVFCLGFGALCARSVSGAAAVMERGLAAALTCAGELIPAGLQTLLLLLQCWIRLGPWESIRRWAMEAKFNWLL